MEKNKVKNDKIQNDKVQKDKVQPDDEISNEDLDKVAGGDCNSVLQGVSTTRKTKLGS